MSIIRTQWVNGNKQVYFMLPLVQCTVYPKKYAHGFCFAVLCCGYTLTDFPISIRLTSLALWQSNDCPSASKATLMNMDKYFMWIHHERLHNHNKAKHNKTVCIFLGIYCRLQWLQCWIFLLGEKNTACRYILLVSLNLRLNLKNIYSKHKYHTTLVVLQHGVSLCIFM